MSDAERHEWIWRPWKFYQRVCTHKSLLFLTFSFYFPSKPFLNLKPRANRIWRADKTLKPARQQQGRRAYVDREEYTNIMDHVKNLWSRYLQWVSENPTLATEMETSIKWISLIATGRNYWSDIEIFFSFYFWTTGYLRNSTNSLLWSELAYSASDLFKFINDRAYEQAFQATNAIKYENIEQLLALLDSAEIFLEIGASLVAGEAAKWIMVSILQVLK